MLKEYKDMRNINFEILRILAMWMIIIGHSIGHTYLLEDINQNSSIYYFIKLLQIFCNSATNIYVILSGYFLVDKKFEIKRLIILWLQVLFYSIFLYLVFNIFIFKEVSLKDILKVILPISGNQYWFMRVYLIMFLFFPYINILVKNLSKKKYHILLILCIVIFSLWRSFLPFAITVNNEGGNSILWFVVLYLFGAYLKKYGVNYSIKFSILFVIINILFSFFSSIIISQISFELGFSGRGSSLFTEFTSFPMLFSAFFIVNIVAKCNFNSTCKIGLRNLILILSSSSLSVYLIHENRYVKRWMWDFININQFSENKIIILLILIVGIGIYVCSTILDKLTWKKFSNYLIKNKNFDRIQKYFD